MIKSIAHSGLDWIRRNIYERPSESFRNARYWTWNNFLSRHRQEEFLRDGILILPGYFSGPQLEELQCAFHLCLETMPLRAHGMQESNRMLPSFWNAAQDPYLMHLLEHYWGWRVGCTGFAAKRLIPIEPVEYDSYQWHHDNEGKRLRMLIYLTDVGPEDQRMDYIPGRQRLNWDSLEHANNLHFAKMCGTVENLFGKVISCIGPAGTVILFDANGLHRGNRNMSTTRDSLNFRFTSTHWTRFSAKFPRPFIKP